MKTTTLAALLAALCLAGCGEDFDPYNRLTRLRVLAIASEPPAPLPGETATLSALVYAPGGAPVTYRWSWCPFPAPTSDGAQCRVTAEDLQMLAGAGLTLPAFDLGAEPTAKLPNAVPAELLAQLCAGRPDLPAKPDCDDGFPAQVKLEVSTPGDTVVAVRTLRLAFDPARHRHTNPRLDGLFAVVGGAEQALTDEPMVTLPRDEKTKLRALVDPAQAELLPPNEEGAVLPERLSLSWFVETGDTKDERTGTIPGSVPLERAVLNEWTPAKAKDYPAETARIYIVIRDERLGVSWRSAAVRLQEAP